MTIPTPSDPPSSLERLWLALALIPTGKVATYGQLANFIGLPGAARFIGQSLRKLPADTQLPWHRIVNAGGNISFDRHSDSFRIQQQRLNDEGVIFNNGRIDLQHFQWQPD